MNELYFAKGKAPEIDASKWKVLPSRRTFESPFTSVAPNPLHIFLQGVESAINTEAPESSAPSDSLTDDEKCPPHPSTLARALGALAPHNLCTRASQPLHPAVKLTHSCAGNFGLDPGASWAAALLCL